MINTYFWILLGFVVFNALFEFILTYLNTKNLDQPLPIEFKSAFRKNSYKKAISYGKESSRISLYRIGADLLFMLCFWFSGGFGILDGWVRSLGFSSPIITGVIFALILETFEEILFLGFDLYETFVLDKKYGFTTTSKLLYLKDFLKNKGVSSLFSAIFLAYFMFCFDFFAIWAIPVLIVSTLLIDYSMTKWLGFWMMGFFNKFTPLPKGALRNAITKYARRVGFPHNDVYVMDASTRSKETNAFFTGLGNSRRIVLYDTLIEDHSTAEIVAVIGHEVGHCVHKHVAKGMIFDVINSIVGISLLYYFSQQIGLFQAFGVKEPSIYVAIPLLHVVKIPWVIFMSTLTNIFSRKWEREADQYELDTVGDPKASVRAFKNLASSNLAGLTPHPWYVFFCYSHPPLVERVRKAIDYVKTHQKEG